MLLAVKQKNIENIKEHYCVDLDKKYEGERGVVSAVKISGCSGNVPVTVNLPFFSTL